LLIDEQQAVVGTARAPLTVQQPHPTWSEQHPANWWRALESAMDALHQQHPQALACLQGVGLSGQMHGAVLLDVQDQVLRPAMLWNDGRSAAQCLRLTGDVPDLHRITGNLAMPGFTAPKLLWVQAHEPAVFAQVRRVLLPKDWLRLQLTGETATDLSDASGTLWLDTGRRDWSDAVLAACGLDRSHMPRLLEGSEVSGWLKPVWCQRWGLPARVPVAAGAGDNAASAVGMGCVSAGQGFVSLGTSGVVFLAGERFEPNPAQAVHAFCHALPGRWHQMSVMLSAASAVTWAARHLGYSNEAQLLADAATLSTAQQDRAPFFLPYLNGERSPHNNPHAPACWLGMTSGHGRADLAFAVAEGVGLGLRDGLLTLGGRGPIQRLSLVGGGARSAWWSQCLSHMLGVRLDVHTGAETGAALGAARLACLAAGGNEQVVCTPPPVAHGFEPQPAQTERWAHRHSRFTALYAALAPLFPAG
jgi:xylulokinase